MSADARQANEQRQSGIACPRCGCRDLRVIYTRHQRGGRIRRRRECRHCGRRITTDEKPLGG